MPRCRCARQSWACYGGFAMRVCARRCMWLLVSLALVLSAGVAGPAWADEEKPAPETGVAGRPDWVSAVVTARVTGGPVEVLSEKTETMRVWAQPDGSVVEEYAAAPVRFQDEESGEWVDISTELAASKDGAVPAAMPVDVRLGSGKDPLIVFDAGGPGEVSFGIPDVVLPEPVLDGSVGLYEEVFPGVDLSVEVRSGGFEVLWVVQTPEAARGLMKRFGDDEGQLRLPAEIATAGGAKMDRRGSVQVLDADGDQAGLFAEPMMWDSSAGPRDLRGEAESVAFVPDAPVMVGRPVEELPVEVVAEKSWLLDKARVFPVMIDPMYAVAQGGPVFDTFVQQGFTTDQSASAELKLGNNGSGQVARSFLNFDATLFKGRQIVSADLSLWESWSWSCTPRSFSSYDAGLASTSSRWTAQPSVGTKRASLSTAKGYSSSCPAARVVLDMTAQAQAWSSTSASQVGMMLRADDEASAEGWKRFHSAEGANKPVLTVQYNRGPATPVVPAVNGRSAAVTVVEGGTKQFVGSARPALTVPTSDPDLDTVRVEFAYFLSSATTGGTVLCTTGYVASGASASCVPSVDLPDNKDVWIRARAHDGRAWSAWSGASESRTAQKPPPTPTISCPTPNGSWSDTSRPAEVCTVTLSSNSAQASSAPTEMWWKVNGGAEQNVKFTQLASGATSTRTVTIGGTEGAHSLTVWAKNPGGHVSGTAAYAFGYGKPSVLAPIPRTTTHGDVAVDVSGPPKETGGSVTGATQWRVKGSGDSAWTAAKGSSSVTVTTSTSQTKLTGRFDMAALAGEKDSNGTGVEVPKRTSTVIEFRGCFTYSGIATPKCTDPVEIVRVPHAFGAGYPVTDVVDGQVALWTGEFQSAVTDAELSTPDGGLSVSRVHSTFQGAAAPQNAVFGPGWVASFEGNSAGVSGAELVDNTLIDGTLVLIGADGSVIPFAADYDRRTTAHIPVTSASMEYEAFTPDGEASGLQLLVKSASLVEVVDEDGIITRFEVTTAPTTTKAAVFRAKEVHDPVIAQKTSYTYDASGRVVRITAGLPDGIAAGACDSGGAVAGCRSLTFTYATATTATSSTPGDYVGRVKSISAQANAEAAKVLSTYVYDTAGRMVKQTDSVTGLVTEYGWTTATGAPGQALLASVKQPGLTPVSYAYETTARLSKVTRAVPATAGGGTAQLAAFVYDPQNGTSVVVPGSGINAVLSQFDGYVLPRKATRGFAVFGPDAPISGTPGAGSALWRQADLWLTDDEGYTVHEARYGAGAWQLTANVYDAHDNVIKSWDTRATEAIRTGVVTDIEASATKTVFNADIKNAAGEVITPAGTLVTDVYSPAALLRDKNGSLVMLRRHAITTYDQGAPNAGINPATSAPYRLTTKVEVRSEHLNGALDRVLTTTWSGYDAVVAGDKTGWELGQPTSSTLDMNTNGTIDGPDLTTKTRYDERGRIIEERKPGATGTDAATRVTVYWTAGANPRDAQCGNQLTWAGYVCKTGPAGQPGGTTVPVTYTRDYRWDGQAATVQEVSGGVTRTTTTTFDAKARPSTEAVSVSGLSGSQAIPTVTTTYVEATGKIAGTSSTAGTTAFAYDAWGRETSYTTHAAGQSAETTTTLYNQLGDVTKVTTPQSVTDYTYDGVDANGQQETRGLLTKTVTTMAGRTLQATGAYDAHGALTTEKLPGGVVRRETYDLIGELVSVQYNGTTTAGSDKPWIGWSLETNAAGQIEREYTPAGAAHGSLPGAPAVVADATYDYDQAGRLTTVKDATRAAAAANTCTVRTYGFDQRGNRTSYTEAVGSGCGSTTQTLSQARTYDGFGRPLTGANNQGSYAYDALGRQTSIPAADAPNPAAGNITLGYYHDDSARTISQGTATLTYTLDGAGRRVVETQAEGGTTKRTTVNHYRDTGDNPHWITSTSAAGPSTVVYGDMVSDDLSVAVTQDSTGTKAELTLLTPRGDVASTITVPTSGTAAGLDSYTHYTEFGKPLTPPPSGTSGVAAAGYGWLGAHQRTATSIGIVLMGSRLYNTATGLFTSIDPVWGGNETVYGYPNDPINKQDTTGQAWWDTALMVASFVPGPIGAVASIGLAVSAASRGDWLGAGLSLLGPLGKTVSWGYKAAKLAGSIHTGAKAKKLRAAVYATHRGWGKRQKLLKSTWDDRRTIVRNGRRGMTSRQSFVYHYAKHGRTSVSAYQKSAYQFRNANLGKRAKVKGSPGGIVNGWRLGSHW